MITANTPVVCKQHIFIFDIDKINVRVENIKRMSLDLYYEYKNGKANQLVAFGKQKIVFADLAEKSIPNSEAVMRNLKL